jgi:hypothetical protein
MQTAARYWSIIGASETGRVHAMQHASALKVTNGRSFIQYAFPRNDN